MIKKKSLYDRFVRYARVDTQSAEDTGLHPSTGKQFDLARMLAGELREMGADVDFDEEHCYVYAAVPGQAGAVSGAPPGNRWRKPCRTPGSAAPA